MTKWQVTILTATALALITIGCHDVNGPMAHSLQPPTAVRKTVSGAPDHTFSISAAQGFPATLNYLMQFPWDTWVTLEAIGTVHFYRKPPINGASANYTALYPGRDVGATGIVDPYGDPCVMNLILMDAGVGMYSWGNCGSAARTVDTVLSLKLHNPYIIRGPLPSKHYYNCSNYTDVCDSTSLGAASSVREQPVPVTLNKLTARPRTMDPLHLAPVQFTGSITPDSIAVRGGKSAHPYHVTLWQWIGADSTRDPVLTGNGKGPGCDTTLLCRYTPPESGRMIVKAYVGGWEQTSSVTVQCVMSPDESALNDSTNDFSAREELLDARRQANVDSAYDKGWTVDHPKGWKNETPGVLWQLPSGSGFQFVPYNDPGSTACRSSLPDSEFDPSHAPVPGATPYSGVHAHPTGPLQRMYGCDSVVVKGVTVRAAQFPGELDSNGNPVPFPRAAWEDSTVAGSDDDWKWVKRTGRKMFIVTEFGFVFRLDPPPGTTIRGPHLTWSATNIVGGKCTWAKKYQG